MKYICGFSDAAFVEYTFLLMALTQIAHHFVRKQLCACVRVSLCECARVCVVSVAPCAFLDC